MNKVKTMFKITCNQEQTLIPVTLKTNYDFTFVVCTFNEVIAKCTPVFQEADTVATCKL